jgi:serine/threonine protein kinase
MKYLEANNIIHRDLALRNILVTAGDKGEYICKVSDFGMSRSVEKGYYKTNDKKMPIKWSAPEVNFKENFLLNSSLFNMARLVPRVMYGHLESAFGRCGAMEWCHILDGRMML